MRRIGGLLLTLGACLFVLGCPDPEVEGDEAGECDDGVDNDQDGKTDCDDPTCSDASVCAGDDDDTTAGDDDDLADDDSAGDDDDTSDPLAREDTFTQGSVEATDLLFVIDNSGSMIEELESVPRNLEEFANRWITLAGDVDDTLDAWDLDYHLGVTVLDQYEGQPEIGALLGDPPFVTVETASAVDTFVGTVESVGNQGMGAVEVGLEASHRALTPPLSTGVNDGFYREEARLSIVFVHDEPDSTTTGKEGITAEEYIPWVTSFKESGLDDLYLLAIVGDAPSGCNSGFADAGAGFGYLLVVDSLPADHAAFQSICDEWWTDALEGVIRFAAGLTTAFELSDVPAAGTLDVHVDPDGEDDPATELAAAFDPTCASAWSYDLSEDGKTLEFCPESIPPHSATIRAEYRIE